MVKPSTNSSGRDEPWYGDVFMPPAPNHSTEPGVHLCSALWQNLLVKKMFSPIICIQTPLDVNVAPSISLLYCYCSIAVT